MQNDNLYTIKKGDTFWELESEWNIPYGTLIKLNPDVDPKKLQIGQIVKIKMPTVIYLIADPICYTKHNNLFSNSNEIFQRSHFVETQYKYTEMTLKGMSNMTEFMSLGNVMKTRVLKSNELWHFQKNGTFTHRWKTMKSGASHWKNNIVTQHRTAFRAASQARAIAPTVMRYTGRFLLIADIGLSGKLRPSHIVSTVLLGASSTGVGAIIAGIYFVTDIGTGYVTGKSMSQRLDGWVENNYGQIKLYEGLY